MNNSSNLKDEKEKFNEIEKEKNKLKEIFETEKTNLNLFVFFLFYCFCWIYNKKINETKSAYEAKCTEFQKIIEEKDCTIESLQLDIIELKDAVDHIFILFYLNYIR